MIIQPNIQMCGIADLSKFGLVVEFRIDSLLRADFLLYTITSVVE